MKIMVTGGFGFIGSNFIKLVLDERKEWLVTNLDSATYAGNPENLRHVDDHPNYRHVYGSISDPGAVNDVLLTPHDVILNFAAESHVDRSLAGAALFARTNLEGTVTLLDAARRCKVGRFIQISTDEVYGSLPETGAFVETTPLHPNNPYAASKAAADHMVQAYAHTFSLNTTITRSSNNYGVYQYPEKFIPLVISRAMEGKKIPVYGDGMQVRDWLNVQDNCRGILAALERGKPGQIYNLGGGNERTNLEIVMTVLAIMRLPETLIEHVTDRLGHDRRYAVDGAKARKELGWSPKVPFEVGLEHTVHWYQANSKWIASSQSRMNNR